MDWETLAKQNKELEAAFDGLAAIFDQARQKFKEKQQRIRQMIELSQAEEAQNLAAIHSALDKILKTSEIPGQNQQK